MGVTPVWECAHDPLKVFMSCEACSSARISELEAKVGELALQASTKAQLLTQCEVELNRTQNSTVDVRAENLKLKRQIRQTLDLCTADKTDSSIVVGMNRILRGQKYPSG